MRWLTSPPWRTLLTRMSRRASAILEGLRRNPALGKALLALRRGGPARWVTAGLAAVAVAAIATGVILQVAYGGRILPNTRVAGVEVGGLHPTAAEERLRARDESGRAMTFRHGRRTFSIPAEKVAYRVDARRSARRALAAGPTGPLSGMWSPLVALWTSRVVTPVDAVDRKRLDAAVARIAGRVDRPLSHGDLRVDPETLRVTTRPPEPGYRVDRKAAARAVVTGLRGDGTEPLRLPGATFSVDPERVEAVARQARKYLRSPVLLTGKPGDSAQSGTGNGAESNTGKSAESVRISPRDLAPALAIQPAGSNRDPDVRLGLARKPLRDLVAEAADEVDKEPVDARLDAPARPVVVDEQGSMSWEPRSGDVEVDPGRSGRELDRRATARTLSRMVREGKHRGTLPLRVAAPEVPTDAARRVTSIIGTFTTYFACCEPRVTNIKRIAEAIDGTVVPPGKGFSLNEVAGPRTRAKGYVPAPFIYKGKLKPDVGGGVSQMATTMYNAAYFAGLPLHRFMPHSYYISRYPPGRESTLNYPTIDMSWGNDTGTPVLVRTATTDTSVTVTLYGDNGGRVVRAQTGERRAWKQGDFMITVTRVIVYPDGREARQPYTTRYDKPPED